MHASLSLSLASAALASAASIPVAARQEEPAAPNAKVLVGAPGQIYVYDFDGTTFEEVASDLQEGTGPSWMAFKEPNHIYANDENGQDLRHFTFDAATNELELQETVEGALGVVHLEMNAEATRMVGSSYSDGVLDVWDISNSTLRHMKTIPTNGTAGPHENQSGPTAHQSVLDPTGRYFVVNDLGTDTLYIIDSAEDAWDIVGRVDGSAFDNPGCGPRHGVFIPDTADTALYALVCELSNHVMVFQASYEEHLTLTLQDKLSTFGGVFPADNSTTAAAGAITVSADNRHVYVSNRLTDGTVDNIVHFTVTDACKKHPRTLKPTSSVESEGYVPRMFSLNFDESVLFSTNQQGGFGLTAFSRTAEGELEINSDVEGIDVETYGDEGFGPQFVCQIA